MQKLTCLFLFLHLVAALHAQKALRAELRPYNGRATIFINDKPEAPFLYALTDVPGGRWSWEEIPQHNLRQFYADGVRLFQVDLFLEHCWMPDGSLDLGLARRQVRGVLDACPDAAVMIRLHVNAPRWWQTQHPEEWAAYDGVEPSPDVNGSLQRLLEADPRNGQRVSLASERWAREAGYQVARFCKKFSRTREGRAVFAIQVAGGIYGEWHQWGFLKWEADVSQAMTRHFGNWLRERYGNDSALQKAWNLPQASFDSIRVPDTRQRAVLSGGYFRDPAYDQPVVDYYRCQHELAADRILFFCKQVKDNWKRPVITGAFYGYFFSCFNRQAAGGHLEAGRVLRSPHIDFLAGPQAYLPEAAKAGEPYRSRGLLASVRAHGKLWLDEMDQQPRRAFQYPGGVFDNTARYQKTVSENTALLRRNLLFAAHQGMGLWLYDFGPAGMDLNPDNERSTQHGVTGYWDNPAYHQTIREVKKLYDEQLHQPYRPEADVLLVYDTEVNYHTPSTLSYPDSVSLQLIDYASLALYYAGAAFDVAYLDDLSRLDLAPYRLVIFANTFLLDARERSIIRQQALRDGRHVLWCHAPGYLAGGRPGLPEMEAATGLRFDTLPARRGASVRLELPADTLEEKIWGLTRPLFALADSTVRPLGRYTPGGQIAAGSRSFPTYTAWYTAAPPLDYRFWQYLLDQAGCRVYNRDKNVVYAGAGMLTFHTKNGGACRLQLRNGRQVALNLPAEATTVVLDSQTGAVLLPKMLSKPAAD